MLLKEFELELEKESVSNLNPIPYVVWLVGNGIGINSRICLVCRKWNWNSCKMIKLPFLSVLLNFTLFSNLYVKIHYENYKNGKISTVVVVMVAVALIVVAEVVVMVAVSASGDNDGDYGAGGGGGSGGSGDGGNVGNGGGGSVICGGGGGSIGG
uniref:Uncharacterized protein n=1 Tax=Lactuca sativa TaxID=4236 RepID=A0A9R1VWY3_LACSA|nr:hypothetical protein LSAT_V11C400180450 [Lactuca sativa]